MSHAKARRREEGTKEKSLSGSPFAASRLRVKSTPSFGPAWLRTWNVPRLQTLSRSTMHRVFHHRAIATACTAFAFACAAVAGAESSYVFALSWSTSRTGL